MILTRRIIAAALALALVTPAFAQQGSLTIPLSGPNTFGGPTGVASQINAALLATQARNAGTVAPTNGAGGAPFAYQEWMDTSAQPRLLKVYTGSTWTTTASFDTSTGAWTIPVSAGGTGCNVAAGSCIDAVSGWSATGLIFRTGAGAYAFRAITGTANEISVANGDGVSGAPTLSLPSALTFTGKTITGGSFASPALTTPTLGVATATSINKLAITAPATGSTLTVDDGKTLRSSASLTLAGPDGTLTFQGADTYVGRATADTLTNKTLTAPVISGGTVDDAAIGGTTPASGRFTGLTATQTLALSGVISPSQITGDVNDYAPTGFSTATVLRLDSSGSWAITGLTAGAGGRIITLTNVSANGLTLSNESGGSGAANRFALGGSDLSLPGGQSVVLLYDATSSRWRPIAVPAAAGGGSGTVTSVACGDGLSGGTITTTGACAARIGFADGLSNCALAASVSSNALTIAIKDSSGSDPSSSSPCLVPFRSATAANGDFSIAKIQAATSLVVSSGSTFGTANSVPFRLWIGGFLDGATFRLAAVNVRSATNGCMAVADDGLYSATSEGGSGGADSAQTIYSDATVTTKPYRLMGYLEYGSGLSTAGSYDSAPSRLQLFSPGIARPCSVVQTAFAQKTDSGSFNPGSSTVWADVAGLSTSLAVQSPVNMVMLHATITGTDNAAQSRVGFAFTRGSTQLGLADAAGSRLLVSAGTLMGTGGGFNFGSFSFQHVDFPGAAGATTYKVQGLGSDTVYINRSASDPNSAPYMRGVSSLMITEIQG